MRSILVMLMFLAIPLLLAACFHDSGSTTPPPGNGTPGPENTALKIQHNAPAQAKVGEVFTVQVTVTVKKSVAAVSIREQLAGLTLVDKGDFTLVEESMLRHAVIYPNAKEAITFSYEASCPSAAKFLVIGFAETRDEPMVMESSSIECIE